MIFFLLMKDDFLKYQAQTSSTPLAIEIESAKGSYIYSVDGKKYLDFIAGVSANTFGHQHPRINKAIKKQQKKTANSKWVLDHEPPLVTRYYKGATGEKAGFKMTDGERKASGKNRNRMTPQPRFESDAQGGEMSAKSQAYRKEFFGK